MVQFKGNGRSYGGYMARAASPGPGIVLIQEWWGLVPHIVNVADRLAAEGFCVLAPDFYHGSQAAEPEQAGKLMMALEISDAEKVISGAVDAALEEATGERAGVMGFCMGGQLALYAAAINSKIGACVDFYGVHPHVKPPLENLACPVLGLFAEFDEYNPHQSVAALGARLTNLGKEHEFITYPGTHHAFFNDDRPEVYDAQAAQDAWERVLRFFWTHLRDGSS